MKSSQVRKDPQRLVKLSEDWHIIAAEVFAFWEAPGLPNLEEMGRVRGSNICRCLVASGGCGQEDTLVSGNVEHGSAAAEPKRCVQRRLGLDRLSGAGQPWNSFHPWRRCVRRIQLVTAQPAIFG